MKENVSSSQDLSFPLLHLQFIIYIKVFWFGRFTLHIIDEQTEALGRNWNEMWVQALGQVLPNGSVTSWWHISEGCVPALPLCSALFQNLAPTTYGCSNSTER